MVAIAAAIRTAPWEYRRLRAWAGIRVASAIILANLAVVTFALGGNDPKAQEFAAVFLAAEALSL